MVLLFRLQWLHLSNSMRLNMCPLNSCLHKINVKESPSCVCGAASDSIEHFLLVCPLHALPHRELLQITLPYILYNLDVFKAVGKYTTITKRFSHK